MRSLWEETLETACTQLRAWREAGREPVALGLHLSANQLRRLDLVEVVRRCLERTGADPSLLELEIPESAAVGQEAVVMEALAGIDALGVGFALSEIGTGASSFANLSRYPVRRLKLDGGLVHGLVTRGDAEILAHAVVAIAHRLNMVVTAAEVETEAELACLRALGCDEIQGPLTSPPLPADAFERLLSAPKDEGPTA